MAGRKHEVDEDHFGPGAAMQTAGEFQQGIHQTPRLGLLDFPIVRQMAQIPATRFEGNQHRDFRTEGIQRTVFVHDLGRVIVIIAPPHFTGHAVRFAEMFKQVVKRKQAATPQQSKFEGSEAVLRPARQAAQAGFLPKCRQQSQFCGLLRPAGATVQQGPKGWILIQKKLF